MIKNKYPFVFIVFILFLGIFAYFHSENTTIIDGVYTMRNSRDLHLTEYSETFQNHQKYVDQRIQSKNILQDCEAVGPSGTGQSCTKILNAEILRDDDIYGVVYTLERISWEYKDGEQFEQPAGLAYIVDVLFPNGILVTDRNVQIGTGKNTITKGKIRDIVNSIKEK